MLKPTGITNNTVTRNAGPHGRVDGPDRTAAAQRSDRGGSPRAGEGQHRRYARGLRLGLRRFPRPALYKLRGRRVLEERSLPRPGVHDAHFQTDAFWRLLPFPPLLRGNPPNDPLNGFEDVAALGAQKVIVDRGVRGQRAGRLERPATVEVDIGDAGRQLLVRPAKVASRQNRDTRIFE